MSYPNTSNFVKNTPLRVVLSTPFSVFGCPDETLFLVFDILLINLKEKMEQMYDKKVEGIIIRSRARWYEHGEKKSKYFFNLEKRSHIRNHIRKLRLSGVITVDPFEILEGEKKFSENVYKSR